MRNVEYIISLRDRFSKKLSGIQKRTSVFQSSIGKVGGAIGLAFGGAVALRGAKNLLELGGKLELIDKKAKIVFGSYEKNIKSFAKTNAAAMGLTESELVESAAAIGDLLIPMGIQRDVATDMTKRLVNLSGALSEWTGGQKTAQEVGKTLAKAVLGEREQLKELGVSIMESDVQLELMRRGMDKLTGNALKQARAMITIDMLYQRTEDAQKSYESGAGSLVRIKSELIAKLKTYRDILAVKLIPIFKKVIDKVGKMIIFFEEHKDLLISLAKGIGILVGALAVLKISIWAINAAMAANPVGAIITGVALLITGIIHLWKTSDKFRATIMGIWEAMKVAVENIGIFIGSIFGFIKKQFNKIIAPFKWLWEQLYGVRQEFKKLWESAKENLSKIGEFFKKIWAGIKKTVESAIEPIKWLWEKVFGKTEYKSITKAFTKGYLKELAETITGVGVVADEADDETNDETNDEPDGDDRRLGAGIAGVTAGAPKTFNINIEKLVGIEEFITNNVRQGINQMGEEIKKQLLIALRDTQIIAD